MILRCTIIGIIPTDERFEKIRNIYNAYVEAGMRVPTNIMEYFDNKNPNDVTELDVDINMALHRTSGPDGEIFEIELSRLPRTDITAIRFTVK